MTENAVGCKNGEKGNCNLQARAILQQCLSARLQVQPSTEESEAKFVEVCQENHNKWAR